jgi:hypothetical protein
VNLETVDKLLALAFNAGARDEEKLTAAELACKGLVELKLLVRMPTREKSLEACLGYLERIRDRDGVAPGRNGRVGRDRPFDHPTRVPPQDLTPIARRMGLCPLCGTRINHVHASPYPVYDLKTGEYEHENRHWEPRGRKRLRERW